VPPLLPRLTPSRLPEPYGSVLGQPGAAAFSAAGLLARLPISMLGIGIVLLVEASTGSYAAAGTVAAVYSVVQALCSPVVARLVDRHGQAAVMRPAVAVHVAGVVALVVLTTSGAPLPALLAAAVVMGSSIGSVGALVRARWAWVLTRAGGPVAARLHTAFSLESVVDEVVFLVGPVVVTLLATRAGPAWGLLAAAAAVTVGGAVLFAQRATEPAPVRRRAGDPGGGRAVLRSGGMVVLVVAFAFLGVVFGSVEVLVVAFTDERGRPGLAGVVLALYAVGSLVAGLVYGALRWRSSDARRFTAAMPLMAVLMAPLVLVDSVVGLALALVVAGVAISPTIISGNALVRALVAPHRLTEGLTWVSTAMGVGISAGAAVAGHAVDRSGAQGALLLPVVAGAGAGVTVLLCARWLTASGTSGTPSGSPSSAPV